MTETGPLAEKVLEYVDAIETVVKDATSAEDFAPVAELVEVDTFERVGTFLEHQDWAAYAEFLAGWASAIDSFESHTRRITEVEGRAFYETEEQHFHGDSSTVLNTLTIFEFGDTGKIRRLDVFMQKAP